MTATAPSTRHRSLAVGLVMAITMNAFEAMAVVTAMPAVSDDLGGDRFYGAAFSAYMLANLVSLVATGEQADRRGPFAPFLVGVVTFAGGLVLAGAAPEMLVVVAGRVLQGYGAGALAAVTYVAIGRAWPPDRQPRMFATVSAAWVVPALVAPALAGVVTEQAGWRWVFFGLVPLLPVLLTLAGPSLHALGPPSTTVASGSSRVPRALVLAFGVALLVGGLASEQPVVLAALVAAGLAVAVPAAARLFPAGTGRAAPGLPATVASRFAVNVAFFGTDIFLPLAATRIHGTSTTVGGALLVGGSLLWTAGAWWSAQRSATVAPGVLVRTGFVVLTLAIVLTLPVVWPWWPLAVAFVTWSAGGFGVGLVFNTTASSAMGSADEGQEGLVSSQLQMADTLGFAVVSGIGGAVVGVAERTALTLTAGLGALFLGAAAVALVGVAVGSRVRNRSSAPAGGPGDAPAPQRAARARRRTGGGSARQGCAADRPG